MHKSPRTLFFLVLATWISLLFTVVSFAPRYIQESAFLGSKNGFDQDVPRIAWLWANLDGNHYLSIARNGYFSLEQGFFPLYPLVIRLVHDGINVPYIYSGLMVTYLSFAGFLYMFYKLMRLDFDRNRSFWTLSWMLILPASFHLLAIYNDSLFLFLSVGSLYFARKKNWAAAGVLGMFSALSRLTGIALFPALLIEANQDKSLAGIKKIALFLVPLGTLLYLSYLEVHQGGWRLFMESMAVWGQDKPIFPGQTLFRYAKALSAARKLGIESLVGTIDLVAVFLAGYLFGLGRKVWRSSYQIFCLIVIFIPLFSGTFLGMPRYFYHAFPLVIVFSGIFYERKSAGYVLMILLFVLELYLAAYFSQGHFIA